MLDLMRQANRKKWFLSLLILPVVFSFVFAIFAVWGGAGTRGSASGAAWVARVNNLEISPLELERHRAQIESQYRQMHGDQFDQQAAAFDFDQIALRQLLGQNLAYSEAARLGLKAGEAEVADAIVRMSAFQRNGRFIGREQYLRELQGRGYNVAEFENDIARELAVDRLRDLVGTMVTIDDGEVQKTFADQGQTAEVDFVLLKESEYRTASEPTAKEIDAYYREHRSTYLTPEKRRVAYVLIERDPLQKSVDVPETDIKSYYDKNKESTYHNPEQRRASHILFKVPPELKPEEVETIRKKAEAVLARVRAGEDFAKVATETSEDQGSAQDGGDLQWFGKGRMVPEFEQAAYALSDGQISDLVRTSFGFHIIKMTGSRQPGVIPFEEVHDQIRQQLAFGKTQELLSKKAEDFVAKLSQQSSSFEGTASELGLPVKDTGFFAKGEPAGDLGPIPQGTEEIFRLKPGEHTAQIPTPHGIAFARLTDVQQPAPAAFETVKERVKADLVKSRSLDRARAAGRELVAAGADGFKAAADKKKLEVKSTGGFSRSSAPPEFSDDVKTQVFSHKAGELLGPLDSTEGMVVLKIIKRGPDTPEDIARVKAGLRAQLLQQKRDEAFVALLQRLQHSTSIEYNKDALAQRARRASR